MENYKVPNILQNPLLLNTVVSTGIKGLIEFATLNNVKVINGQDSPFIINAGEKQDEPIGVSKQLGTPIYSSLIFNKGKVLDQNGVEIDFWQDFEIQDCLITVTQSKKIVVTEIQGRDGTVKEYIGMGDFMINIVGRLNGKYNVNPKEDTKILNKILSSGAPLAVSNWYLQNLDINDIVVQDFEFPQIEGRYSTQYFTINAMSDRVVEAKITNQ
jgi:hypothetical protein